MERKKKGLTRERASRIDKPGVLCGAQLGKREKGKDAGKTTNGDQKRVRKKNLIVEKVRKERNIRMEGEIINVKLRS